MNCFNHKVAVVTGAGSGIGRALALQLAGHGARLALSDINATALAETMAALPAGTEARAYSFDIANRDAVFLHALEVQRDFGTAHYVINNAGATMVGTFAHLSTDEIAWQLDINMWGVIYGSKAFLPMMLAQREGCIVNISSVFGLVGFPLQSAYNISKFAVRGLTECLWSELAGTGVRAVCVHPGGIKTNIDKAGRRCAAAGSEERRFDQLATKMLVTPPERCAADILKGIASGKRRILTGKLSTTLYWLARLLPNAYPRLFGLITG
ncbi:SDR family oxidoreductase [Duganella sp. FT3S]|uniref:SDR family oxidoreductase n=1 Tax=Rugamonas fusca TaxID=2758568 RepID=A0A7W2I8P6_9BURK|nr:SDR family oxidoreductase [Rugamonas fusca]MBA5607746.1 SDR family oxidoreductase [Rugamonas fusca]